LLNIAFSRFCSHSLPLKLSDIESRREKGKSGQQSKCRLQRRGHGLALDQYPKREIGQVRRNAINAKVALAGN
jgi:hypothetical protein